MSSLTPVEILLPPLPLAAADGTLLGPFLLGESPVWDAQAGRLWWTDVEARALHSLAFEALA
ncbi:MAG: SMP-30/gluconolactonase/LRE family protein, partial [Burkholderiaceae bacterium]|nr:SMP-30/gluconolactonase/LRE family protein [Burkholderiaceae bacterium]